MIQRTGGGRVDLLDLLPARYGPPGPPPEEARSPEREELESRMAWATLDNFFATVRRKGR